MKRKIPKKTEKAKHEYLVGWTYDWCQVYGKEDRDGKSRWVDPMTLNQARRYVRTLAGSNRRCIYKLVLFKVLK